LDIRRLNTEYYDEKRKHDRKRGVFEGTQEYRELQALERIYQKQGKRVQSYLDQTEFVKSFYKSLAGPAPSSRTLKLKPLRTMHTLQVSKADESPADQTKVPKQWILAANEALSVDWDYLRLIPDPALPFFEYTRRLRERAHRYSD
jgi:hypothetical protein